MASFKPVYGESPKTVYLTPLEKTFLRRSYERTARTTNYTQKVIYHIWFDDYFWDDTDILES